ncbi:hypothetical protein IGI04_007260 [Brassica rapa subsp. trilocularis]|uniref:Uncharacterized protein n=1 Tax=Brassica rapa subsp. trilocularis TaxID=1813537 RepID=A0ABQ7NJ74_BRACM|nr:hypothetical protein IGI04_007260 [Brassica rapa subsp. trilocularis]
MTCVVSPITQNFNTIATNSLMTKNHDLQYLYEPCTIWNQNLQCINTFKMVVLGGWCIDDNGNIVNT